MIVSGVGASPSVGPTSGGWIYAYNKLTTTPEPVAPINQNRRKITFHNPGTVDVMVAQVVVQTTGSDVPLTPSVGALGGCFRVYGNGGTLVVEGECQKAWQAFAISGGGNPLTVVDSNA